MTPEELGLKRPKVTVESLGLRPPQQPAGPAHILWNHLVESGEALGEGAKQLPKEAGSLAVDIWKALMPGREGASAGGRVLEKIGNVGMFASGGGAGPFSPAVPSTGMARGLDVQPRVAQVPTPLLALPPPTIGVPGRAPIETGVGRPEPLSGPGQGAMKYTPPPGSGLIPAGPRSTMTVPAATPPAMGPTRPQTASPLLPADAHAGQPSPIAAAFTSNDPAAVDRALTNRYRGVVRTGGPRPQSGPGLDEQNQRITTAVDSIIDAKDHIRFRDTSDPTGKSLLPAGRLPRTLDQFVQSIDSLKTGIFQQYDYLAKQVGGQGARVSLAPVVAKLRELAMTPQIRDVSANISEAALAQADRFEKVGSYTPLEAQNVIQSMNAELRGLLQKKVPTQEIYSHPTLMNQVRDVLLSTLNQTMDTALQGPQYASLRTRYGALSSIEKDVANALSKQLAKTPGLTDKLLNIGEIGGLIHGTIFFDPKVLGGVASTLAAQHLTRYLRSPNRAVARLFSKRTSELSPSMTDRLSARAAVGVGQMRQRNYDRGVIGPQGGTVTGIERAPPTNSRSISQQ